ncbi:hypothetical protein CSV77_05785 [Sporosarcina sp. P16b]|uniref:hypothetical protein n=1 Tax=Sporosarcina sp. P16b TaxID=2048261 RepID=UPI000C171BA4|nr:hypothetical protein [Sporosarcina sp. P16b]PIC70821.1 hypothetical protein CSV77_05785 [Sporosarcina sp. P16b]
MSGKTLAQGLMASSGEQLRLIYVLVMETGIYNMIANKTKDFLDKDVDHSQRQLDQEIEKLIDVDDNTLRLELFLHMTKEFELAGSHYNTSYEIENKCGEVLQKAHTYQLKKDKSYTDFVSRNLHLSIDNQLALYQMQKIFKSIGGELKNLTADQQESFAGQIEKFIESLPIEQQEKIKEKLNIEAVTNSTITKVLATQGSAVLLAVIVEIAGFTAYTTLTSLIAGTASLIGLTLPFGFYMTATSVLSIITGPIGFILIGGASSMMMLTQSKKVKKTLLQMGIVQLMLPVLLDNEKVFTYDAFIQQWTIHYNKQNQLLDSISQYQKVGTSISQNINATNESIEVNINQLMENNNAYDEIINQFANKLARVNEQEMTESFFKKKMEIANLESQVQQRVNSVETNSQQGSFFGKVRGIISNITDTLDIKNYNEQIQRLKKEQAVELIAIRPSSLREECNEAYTIIEYKKVTLKKLAKLNVQKSILAETLSANNSKLRQEQNALRIFQKKIHGLGDIV